MKFAVVAGGTGGHFYPGLAVAKYLMQKGHEVFFVVRKQDYVISLLERENIPYSKISSSAIPRGFSFRLFVAPFKLGWGLVESFFILRRKKPSVVISMGGYLSFGPVVTAHFLKIPVLLHEQNSRPGLANRVLSRWARMVALSFPQSKPFFTQKTQTTGLPIRDDFRKEISSSGARGSWNLSPTLPTLLVFGGSLGAHRINQLVSSAACELQKEGFSFQLIHFTGKADLDDVGQKYKISNVPSYVDAFCHDMPRAYAAADLVLCRSGASTVAELAALKKPCILIPYPFATDNHQMENAKLLSSAGAARVYPEKDLDVEKLKLILKNYLGNSGRLNEMKGSYDRMDWNPWEAPQNIAAIAENLKPV